MDMDMVGVIIMCLLNIHIPSDKDGHVTPWLRARGCVSEPAARMDEGAYCTVLYMLDVQCVQCAD